MAHGAGRGMANPFMESMARGLIASGVRVVRFHFPFMEQMVRSGKRLPPDRGGVLRQCYSEVIAHCIEMERCPAKNLIIGGKSVGGRIASMVADEHGVAGVVCLGYPFHPPKKPGLWRAEQLQSIATPTLICQGENDPFGTRQEVSRLSLSEAVSLHWLAGGDHNFNPHGVPGLTAKDNLEDAIGACNAFIDKLL